MTDRLLPTGRTALVAKMQTSALIAVIRADSPTQLVDVCRALCDGGVDIAEITMTTPGALDAIAQAREALAGDCVIGVGSVLDAETARAAILADAQYIVAPTLNLDVIQMAHRYDRPIIPGALTPTEIMTAWQAGADMVKVFPANHFGPRYFKDLLAPMPHLKLTPTGGVDLGTAADWLKAGAAALGVGSALVKKDLIRTRDWAGLTKLARQFRDVVDQARG
ncbi:MAG: bifunctional 4-hydroxy-2-oxoglutarate aldolase/2-dehydro-3-deoxy-phosphogluconate aldolase [Phycisphaeraceae bacterium]|nr:bifunctional 4-hydroxy-2-oxoglutarate aldolase/2-dehydro-3-deoxy-phosphogluconate aldolase [Phycisphaeraceae bacterium]